MVKVQKDGGEIFAFTPFNREFISRSKQIGGRWVSSEKAWAFPELAEDKLQEILLELFGYNPAGSGEMYIWEILIPRNKDGEELTILGKRIVARQDRDWNVKWGQDALLLEGEVPKGGGSRKNPRIGHDTDLLVRMLNMPRQAECGEKIEGYEVMACEEQEAFKLAQASRTVDGRRKALEERIEALANALAEAKAELSKL